MQHMFVISPSQMSPPTSDVRVVKSLISKATTTGPRSLSWQIPAARRVLQIYTEIKKRTCLFVTVIYDVYSLIHAYSYVRWAILAR